jgi:hypothetical protein
LNCNGSEIQLWFDKRELPLPPFAVAALVLQGDGEGASGRFAAVKSFGLG